MKTNPTDDAFGSPFDHGLTKREYFAAAALNGLLAGKYNPLEVEKVAVEFADLLIAALNK